MATIGIIVGGFKPFHKGHFFLIEKASAECDLVYLLVGLGDRKRPGEFPISGNAMKTIWNRFIIPTMPSNVKVQLVLNPVTEAYKILVEANENLKDKNVYMVYGDQKDLSTIFSSKNLKKYTPRLEQENRFVAKAFSRENNVNISGTQMRQYLQLGLKDKFIEGLPEQVKPYGNEIWNLLYSEQD